jgi:hypothetical protein
MPSGFADADAVGQAATPQRDAMRSALSGLKRARSPEDRQLRTRGKFGPESGEITLRASLWSEGRPAFRQQAKISEAAGVRPQREHAPVR